MRCPVCSNQTLQRSERQGIQIDHCPQCRGVWLEREALDTLIERSTAMPATSMVRPTRPAAPDGAPPVLHRDTRHLGQREPRKKAQGFLSDLFDF